MWEDKILCEKVKNHVRSSGIRLCVHCSTLCEWFIIFKLKFFKKKNLNDLSTDYCIVYISSYVSSKKENWRYMYLDVNNVMKLKI